MTSSSSPGISLKQEGISYIAGAELPCLIVNVVRGGPGLGTIQPSQCDYFQAVKGGGHGDYHLIVLAPASVQEIADGLPVSRPAVSQHLKALRDAGLVRDEPRGTARIYSIHTPGLRALRDWIDGFWDEALDNFKTHAEKRK